MIGLCAVVTARMVGWLWRWWMRCRGFGSRWLWSRYTWRREVGVLATKLELQEAVEVIEFLVGVYEGRLDDGQLV